VTVTCFVDAQLAGVVEPDREAFELFMLDAAGHLHGDDGAAVPDRHVQVSDLGHEVIARFGRARARGT